MGLFGPPNVAKLKARGSVNGLLKALEYRDHSGVRKAAAEALGQIGDPRAVERLATRLKDSNGSVRKVAVEALVKTGASAVDALATALEDRGLDARIDAAGALGQIGDPRAVEPLAVALKDRDGGVGKAAAEALGRIGDPSAVEPLVTALENRDRGVRIA